MTNRAVTATPVLTICGSGNGGHALAVVASQNFEGDINWLVHTDETAALVHKSMAGEGLRSTGAITAEANRLRVVSSNAADVIPNADIVMIVAPAFAHAEILREIVPYLKESVLIGCLPSRGGFEFEASRLIPGIEPEGQRKVFGLQTLPWSTRIVEKGAVANFSAVKARVSMAALPGWHANDIAIQVSKILGIEIIPTETFLDMTLGNPGQFIHTGLMYGHLASWSGESFDPESIPRFFAHASDRMGALVESMSDEALAIAAALEVESGGRMDVSSITGILDWLRVSYPTQTADTSTAATCFRTGPIHVRPVPTIEAAAGMMVPDFSGRYLCEDVPFGLVITKAIAELAQVDTPTIDQVISWAQEKIGKQYLVNGRLDPNATRDLPIPQNVGCQTPADLVYWYCIRSGAAALVERRTQSRV